MRWRWGLSHARFHLPDCFYVLHVPVSSDPLVEATVDKLISDAKLDEILVRAAKIVPGPGMRDAEQNFIYACDPITICAIITELKEQRSKS